MAKKNCNCENKFPGHSQSGETRHIKVQERKSERKRGNALSSKKYIDPFNSSLLVVPISSSQYPDWISKENPIPPFSFQLTGDGVK